MLPDWVPVGTGTAIPASRDSAIPMGGYLRAINLQGLSTRTWKCGGHNAGALTS